MLLADHQRPAGINLRSALLESGVLNDTYLVRTETKAVLLGLGDPRPQGRPEGDMTGQLWHNFLELSNFLHLSNLKLLPFFFKNITTNKGMLKSGIQT